MIRELIWRIVAFIVTRPAIASWLIERAKRTPYYDITGPDGSLYMGRWWLFNAYGKADGEQTEARWPWLPSIRVHHIMRPDSDRHLHDHPWNARTIVLRGGYEEERYAKYWRDDLARERHASSSDFPAAALRAMIEDRLVRVGHTGRLLFGEFHRISWVPRGGAWTLFFTWRQRGTWGFDVNGVKVHWRKHLGLDKPSEQS